MKILVVFLLFLPFVCEGIRYSNGKSSDTCEDIIIQQYNVNPTTCSSNFAITPSTSTYTIGEPVHITIESTTPDKTFIGLVLLAQDDKDTDVGSWQTVDSVFESVSCGGMMHSSQVGKTSVKAAWHPSSTLVESITIKVIIIENNSTIYINCYQIVLTLRDEQDTDTNTSTTATTTVLPPTTSNTTITPTSTASSRTDTPWPTPSNTTVTSTPTTSNTTVSPLPTTLDTTINSSPTTITSTNTQSTTTVISSTQSGNTTKAPSPTAEVAINTSWIFNDVTKVTNVSMSVTNLKTGQWAAIGLGTGESMGENHVFMCKRLRDNSIVINRYINPNGHEDPQSAGSEQGGVLTPGQQQFNDGLVVCQFTLSNFTTQTSEQLKDIQPLSQSTQYHPKFAVGLLDDDSEPNQHDKKSRDFQTNLVRLNTNEVILYKLNSTGGGSDPVKFLKVHGIIMVFTWILIVSTGILISRYFKNSWTNNLICGKAAWFAAHRFLMSTAAILTVLGFLFIFVYLEGGWVEKGFTRQYVHSITGVIVICLAFFQPFIALFRCEPESQYRFIFNLIHLFVGFVTFILSIATLFLATYFKLFKDNKARIIMIVWTVWIVFIFTVFEFIQYHLRKTLAGPHYTNINASNTGIREIVEVSAYPKITLTGSSDQQEAGFHQKLKNILLATHILIAIVLSSIFTGIIV